MKLFKTILIFFVFFTLKTALSQTTQYNSNPKPNKMNGGGMSIGRLSGKVKDALNNSAIEYASVQLWVNKTDSASKQTKLVMVGGMLTNNFGEFLIENLNLFGSYKIQISAIGYETFEQPFKFDFDPKKFQNGSERASILEKADKDIGNIRLKINTKLLKEVTIEAQNSLYQMRVDRKVFSVDKNIVSAGGTAEDVMKNIPSVQVDVDGNVTLRNATPQIYVDGKPTTLTLEQIPADDIQSVEIITNPSAKFDAGDSNSGILNIVLKKSIKPGYNGNIRIGAGALLKYNFGGDINVKEGKWNFFMGGTMVKRNVNPKTSTLRRSKETGNESDQYSEATNQNSFNTVRAGIDYFINNRNTITISQSLIDGRMLNNDHTENDSIKNSEISSYFTRDLSTNFHFRNNMSQIGFKHLFPKQGEEITADVNYSYPTNDNNGKYITQNFTSAGTKISNTNFQKTAGGGYNRLLVGQLDFVNPINENSKFEAGARMSMRDFANKTEISLSKNDTSYEVNDFLSSQYSFKDNVYALYATYSGNLSKLLYQIGSRVESSDYTGNVINRGKTFHVQYPFSFFPSLNLAYKLSNNRDIQLNYSRKINRPNFFQLMPFPDFTDPQNISIGNPGLTPEFNNTVDIDFQKMTQKGFNFLVSAYLKYTNNLITRYQYKGLGVNGVDSAIFNTFQNSSYSQSYGIEITAKTPFFKWWEIISNLNIYNAAIKGTDILFTERLSAFAKMNWNFSLPKNISLQISGDYQSKTVLPVGGSGSGNTSGGGGMGGGRSGGQAWGMGGGPRDQQLSSAQGYVNPNYGMDVAIKWEIIKNVASIGVTVSDVLKTKRYSSFSETPYFTQDYTRRRDQQIIRFNASYRFGKMDASLFKRKNNRMDSEGMQGM